MATSRTSEAGIKQSCGVGTCQVSESGSVKNLSLGGISQVLEATSLKKIAIIGSSSVQEASTVKQKLKTGVILPASEKAILEQASKVVVSRVAELASQKKPLEVEVTSSLSEAGPLESPTL